jgi:mxaL protein
MNKFISLLKSNYESLLLVVVALLLLLAIYKPQIQLKQDVHNYLLVADVSQSMNAQDLKLNNKTISRMDYTKHLMKRVVETSSCGTYISLGVFAAENVGLLLMPLEVCANYDEITDAIDHLEWRMAWRGNSRLSFGVKSAESMFDYLNIPATMLFFTDGDEAPKVNAINILDLSGVQIGKNLLFVGVGGHQPVPIPRYNSSNKWVGYWSSDTKENTAGAVGDTYSDTSKDEPDPIVAYAEFDRYLSQLDSEYLKQLAAEIKGGYIQGQDTEEF